MGLELSPAGSTPVQWPWRADMVLAANSGLGFYLYEWKATVQSWSRITVGAFALYASYTESRKAHRSPKDWCLYSFAQGLVSFHFTPGFKKHVPLGDGRVEERCTKTLLSPCSLCTFVCSPVCRKLVGCVEDIVECLARFRKQALYKDNFLCIWGKVNSDTVVAPAWISICKILI